MSKTFPLIWNQKARSVEFSLSERLHSEMQEFLFDVEKYIDLEGFSVVSAWSNKDIEALRDEFFLSFDRTYFCIDIMSFFLIQSLVVPSIYHHRMFQKFLERKDSEFLELSNGLKELDRYFRLG